MTRRTRTRRWSALALGCAAILALPAQSAAATQGWTGEDVRVAVVHEQRLAVSDGALGADSSSTSADPGIRSIGGRAAPAVIDGSAPGLSPHRVEPGPEETPEDLFAPVFITLAVVLVVLVLASLVVVLIVVSRKRRTDQQDGS